MKICVRENYVDCFVLSRISERTLKKKPYNFQIVEIPDKCFDCAFEDFDVINNNFVFSLEKYNTRKAKADASKKISELKQLLSQSDYIAIKFAEGVIDQNEYEKIKEIRQSYRNQINELEKIINGG